MKSSYILTRERVPSCLPYTLHLLASVYKAPQADSLIQVLVFIASLPTCSSHWTLYCYSYLPSLQLPQGLCIYCPLAKTLFCQIISLLPLLIFFTHLQGGVSWCSLCKCIPHHTALLYFREHITPRYDVIQLFLYFLSLFPLEYQFHEVFFFLACSGFSKLFIIEMMKQSLWEIQNTFK